MELTQEKIDLIGKIIKNDRKYSGNEDLYEDFFSETCTRSAAIIDSIENPATLETYLRRVVTTSIINVLKDSGRLRRSKDGYVPTREVSLDKSNALPEEGIPVLKPFESPIDYSNYYINYSNIKLPPNPEDVAIRKEALEFVADTIIRLDQGDKTQNYLEIFKLRYQQGMTQKEIADELGISQSEVSKRLFSLIDKVKVIIEN